MSVISIKKCLVGSWLVGVFCLIASVASAQTTLAANPVAATTKAGTLVTYTITLTPGAGAAPTFAFTCVDSIPSSGCSFSPTTVSTLSGPVTTSMSVATNLTSLSVPVQGKTEPSQSPLSHPNKALYAMLSLGGAGLFGLVLSARRGQNKRRRWLAAITGLVVFLVVMALQGCGSRTKERTPPGNYSVTVTATSVNTNPSQTVTTMVGLTVQ